MFTPSSAITPHPYKLQSGYKSSLGIEGGINEHIYIYCIQATTKYSASYIVK